MKMLRFFSNSPNKELFSVLEWVTGFAHSVERIGVRNDKDN